MRWLASLTLFVLAALNTQAQVKFPHGPDAALALKATPGSVVIVSTSQICVIEGDKDFFLKASPSSGAIKITKDTGPITYKGEFPDEPGKKNVKRTFKGPFLYQVEGVGDVELFSIPIGVTDEKLILSQAYSFLSDLPPDPIPNPDDSTKPKPGTKLFWLVLVEETADRTAPGLINDKTYWDGYKAKGHNWMSYDQSTDKGKRYKAILDTMNVKLPAVLLLDLKATAPATPLGAVTLASKSEVDTYLKSKGAK